MIFVGLMGYRLTVFLLGDRYDLMLSCWKHKSEERPTFAFVMQVLETILQVGHQCVIYMYLSLTFYPNVCVVVT